MLPSPPSPGRGIKNSEFAKNEGGNPPYVGTDKGFPVLLMLFSITWSVPSFYCKLLFVKPYERIYLQKTF
jgi:hypothetical protein